MNDFDLLFRYWELRARYDALGLALTDAERLELLSLLQLATSDGCLASEMENSQLARSVPVKLTAGSGFLAADLQKLGTDVLVVAAAENLQPGQRTILAFADAVSGVEYSVPCVVRWAREEQPCLMGLAVDGVPTRARFTVPPCRFFRSLLGVGPLYPSVEA